MKETLYVKKKQSSLFFRAFIAFLAILGASSLLIQVFNVEFGETDFWNVHGFGFLIFITLFPRLTLLLSSVPLGGLFWWLGWFFVPRILVACLATVNYFQTNPILVVISWLIAFSGESTEKYVIKTRSAEFQNRKIKDVRSEVVK